mmetsp:Transcript_10560/g.31116  ORF Transcript_10560/g.31116 Transcript_10560/m.31116 type:complete len:84 (+) Transcript_10560:1489-1740(+)
MMEETFFKGMYTTNSKSIGDEIHRRESLQTIAGAGCGLLDIDKAMDNVWCFVLLGRWSNGGLWDVDFGGLAVGSGQGNRERTS